jgi:hypothetical protein
MVCGDGCCGAPSGGTVQQWCHPTWPTQVCTGPHHGGIHHVHCHVQPGRVQLLLLAAAAAGCCCCWLLLRRRRRQARCCTGAGTTVGVLRCMFALHGMWIS